MKHEERIEDWRRVLARLNEGDKVVFEGGAVATKRFHRWESGERYNATPHTPRIIVEAYFEWEED